MKFCSSSFNFSRVGISFLFFPHIGKEGGGEDDLSSLLSTRSILRFSSSSSLQGTTQHHANHSELSFSRSCGEWEEREPFACMCSKDIRSTTHTSRRRKLQQSKEFAIETTDLVLLVFLSFSSSGSAREDCFHEKN